MSDEAEEASGLRPLLKMLRSGDESVIDEMIALTGPSRLLSSSQFTDSPK